MERRAALQAAASGLISTVLFIAVYGTGAGIPFSVLLPALPLLVIGFKLGLTPLLIATGIGTLAILPLSEANAGLFYLGLIGVPCLLFAPAARLAGLRSTGLLLTDLAFYAALVNLGLLLHLDGKAETLIADGIRQNFAHADTTVQATVEQFAAHWSFIAMGASSWMLTLFFYLHALLARKIVSLRTSLPPLSLSPFTLPPFLLGLLAGVAFMCMIAEGEADFMAKTLFIQLLLPYFLLGASVIHARLKPLPWRIPALFILYFFTISQAWPALILACIGVWNQVKTLSHKA